MPSLDRPLQTHGLTSAVYVPILRRIFTKKYTSGATFLDFTLDDVRQAALDLGITVRNPADVIYRMRSRTVLPEEILNAGFYILRQVGRGRYRFEVGESTIIPLPQGAVTEALDLTPLPVRRLLPEAIAEFDEQALLTVVNYCSLLDHFTGLRTYRLRSHVRKSVIGIGQAELDELDVAVALRDDEEPVILPVEAKAAPDAINRVQISAMVAFSRVYFPGHEVRPIAIKVDYDSLVHILEFNPTEEPAQLVVQNAATYQLKLSEQQRRFVRRTETRLI
ncbi:hypothetical protein ACN28C_04935 [Plantactinospora sp. WMMC1484]|uniref:hypothetical protein n=1 Tax=Plantactinospora sp. WMMC1484 TaxID=3404122 RepID=UPI003BF4C539